MGANGASWDTIPFRVIAALGQPFEDNVESARPERRDVFHQNPAGSSLPNESQILEPKTRAGSGDPCPLAGDTEVLAWEAATQNVDRLADVSDSGLGVPVLDSSVGASVQMSDVGETGDEGPVLGEDASTERIDLAGPGGLETSGPLEAKGPSSDARKKFSETELATRIHDATGRAAASSTSVAGRMQCPSRSLIT